MSNDGAPSVGMGRNPSSAGWPAGWAGAKSGGGCLARPVRTEIDQPARRVFRQY